MKPLEDGSPFSKTAAALQTLLDQQEFIGPKDEVHLFLFGDDIADDITWLPGSAQGPLLPMLRQRAQEIANDRTRNDLTNRTDLRAVLRNLQAQLSRNTAFDRQVVIIASDFLHEPSHCEPKDRNSLPFWRCVNADWQQAAVAEVVGLKQSLGERNPFLLGTAPLVKKGQEETHIREQVLSSLSQLMNSPGDKPLELGAGGLNPAAFAQEIRRRLYFPLNVEVRSNREDQELQVEVKNPNAAEVQIAGIQLTCYKDGKSLGDPTSLDFSQTDFAKPLPPHGQVKDVKINLGNDSCLRDASKVQVDLITKEGSRVSAQRDVIWIDPEQVESSALEGNFFLKQGVLRLVVRMRGDAPPGTRFEIAVRRDGGGDGPEIVKGYFYTPRHLSASEARRYLFAFDITRSLREQLVGTELEVQVAMAKELTTKPAEDLKSSHGNGAGSVFAGLALLGTFFLFLSNKHRSKDGIIVKLLEWYHYLTVFLSGIGGLVWGLLRPQLLEVPYLPMPLIWTILSALCLSSLAYIAYRSILNYKLAKIASGPDLPSDLVVESFEGEYRKPLYFAFVVLLLVGVLGWFLAPRGTQGAEPVAVTAEASLAG
jgi:hypothetical protein